MKRLWLLGFGLLLAVLLASCGGESSGSDDGAVKLKETGKDGNLTFMLWGTPEEKSAVYKQLQDFQKANDIGIKVIHSDFLAYNDKLKTMVAGGAAPDVFYMDRPYFYEFASKGVLRNLDDYISEADFNIKDFYPALIDAFTFGGSVYGIPKDWTDFALYYNMDLFDEAGVPYPDETWDWKKFAEAAKKLTKDIDGDGTIDQYGFIMETWADWYYNWIKANAGEIFEKQPNGDMKWVLSSGKYINNNAEAIQFLADLIKAKVAPDPNSSKQLGGHAAFVSGKAAMCIYGRWRFLDFKGINRFKWNVSVMPFQKKKASVFVTVSLAVSSETKNPEAAWKLIKYLTSADALTYMASAGLAIPPRMSMVNSDAFLRSPEIVSNQPHLARKAPEDDPFIKQMDYMVPIPVGPVWIEVRNKLDEQMDDVFLGNKDAKTVILKLESMVDDIMAARNQGPSVGDVE